jgi:type I restriction enzyme S subunit
LPAHWQLNRLKFTARINPEVLSETTHPDYELRYIDITNVDSQGRLRELQTLRFEQAPSRARRRVQDGDVIISTVRTYLRAIAAIQNPPDNLVVSTGFAVLRPGKEYDPRFLWRLIQSTEFVDTVVSHSEGIGYPAINPTELGGLPVWLPPLPEQRVIAAFLDRETARIDALIERKERLLTLLEEKRQAVISHAVTRGLEPNATMKDSGVRWLGIVPKHWIVTSFKRATTRVVVGIAEAATHAYTDEGVPIIRSTNVRPNYLLTDDLLYIQPSFAEQNRSKYLYAGDLVTVRTGYPGVTAVVPQALHRSQCFTLLISTLKANHHPEYFSFVLNSSSSRAYFEVEGWGSAQLNISVPILQYLPVPVPPAEEQANIIEYLRSRLVSLDDTIIRIRDGVARLQEYRTALISAAVTGQIDVRGEVSP